jgi:hypothetical protein
MRQQTLASQASFEKFGRKGKRELFLDQMNQVVPWSELLALVPLATHTASYRARLLSPCFGLPAMMLNALSGNSPLMRYGNGTDDGSD